MNERKDITTGQTTVKYRPIAQYKNEHKYKCIGSHHLAAPYFVTIIEYEYCYGCGTVRQTISKLIKGSYQIENVRYYHLTHGQSETEPECS